MTVVNDDVIHHTPQQTMSSLQIPVFRGCAGPLVGAISLCRDHFGTDGLGDVIEDRDPRWEEKIQKENAVDAMIRIVAENQNRVKEGSVERVLRRVLGFTEPPLSAGLPGGPGPAHQPGSGGPPGSMFPTETQRAVHHGGQHGR